MCIFSYERLHSYIGIIDVNNEQFLEGVDDMVLYFALGVNLSWGSWGIVQAKASTIDFDYLHYAWLRYDAYFYLKDLYYHESNYL